MSRLILAALCHLFLCSWLAAAQDGGPPDTPAAGPAPSARPPQSRHAGIEEVEPKVYWLPDKDGKLQPVLNMTYPEFVKLNDLRLGLTPQGQRPRYSLQRFSGTGTVRGEQAELTIEIRVLVRDKDWVRVPVRLNRAVLREVQYKGQGEQFVEFKGEGEGYVAWIRGKPAAQHQLTLKMLAPLSAVGEETRLKLLVPRAALSELKFTVPVAGAVGKVSEGAALEPPAAKGGTTEFTVLGPGGDFELSWRKPGARVAKVSTVLEAGGTALARIDSRSIDTETTLSVRSHGGPFDRFRVRLPAGAELVPGSPSGYTVTEIGPDKKAKAAKAAKRLVEVRLAQKTSGPVEIRLAATRPHDVTKPGQWFELAGFEVVGAARQWGHVAVAAPGDWQVLWGPSGGVRQVDQLPEALRHEDVVAGFEYFAQPYSLTARLVPKKTRISVEPEYLLMVDPDQVQLKATLKYAIRGAKVFALDVALPGWELDEVGPDNLVAVDGVAMGDAEVLSIPLLQPSGGNIELKIRARRPIAAGAGSLAVALPQPRASSAGPAAVVVLPADNIKLTPNSKASSGLVLQQVAPKMELPDRQQPPLFYRGEATGAVFAADLSIQPQSIAVEVTSRVILDKEEGRVEQKLAYTIRHEPADHLVIEVPRSLDGSDLLEFQHDGKTLTPEDLPEAEGGRGKAEGGRGSPSPLIPGPPDGSVRKRIALAGARIGPCDLIVRYPIPLGKLAAEQPMVLAVPLVMPVEGELAANKLYVTAAPGIKVALRPGSWNVLSSGVAGPGHGRGLRLAAEKRSGQVELIVQLEDDDAAGATVVERAWVQTRLTTKARQDRAVFAFTSNRKELRLRVQGSSTLDPNPSPLDPNPSPLIPNPSYLQVLLNGQPVAAQRAEDGSLVIPLPNDTNRRRRLLELRSSFPRHDGPGRLSIDVPQLDRGVWVRRLYWQVILPKNEHVVVGPAGFTNEFTWGFAWNWDGYFWGRQPLMDQSQLETWVGASHEKDEPQGVNCYLFSTFGSVDQCQSDLRTASRSWIVLCCSGAALAAGLLLIYVPSLHHGATLFCAGVLLLLVGIFYPAPTLLVAQAAGLGLALALVAALLHRGALRRRRETAFPEPSGFLLEKGSTQTQYPPPVAANDVSTRTASPAAPPLSPDSNA